MSGAAEQVIAVFETLPPEEKQAVAQEILRRLPPLDSGPLDDAELALAGDELAAMLERQENDPATR